MAGWSPPPPLSIFLPFYASAAARHPSLPSPLMVPAAALAILESRPSLPDSVAAGAVLGAEGADAGAGSTGDVGAGERTLMSPRRGGLNRRDDRIKLFPPNHLS
jgi:hypothetical protein